MYGDILVYKIVVHRPKVVFLLVKIIKDQYAVMNQPGVKEL